LKVKYYLLCRAEVADLAGVRHGKSEGRGWLKAYITSADEDDQIQQQSLNSSEGLDRRNGEGCFSEYVKALHNMTRHECSVGLVPSNVQCAGGICI
jgi:hypothetical protein